MEDERIARAVAIQKAVEQIAPRGKILEQRALNEAYNDEVILCIVARAICDPNDVDRPFELLPVAEDQLPRAMTPAGVRRLWDELGLLHAGSGVAIPRADDDALARLANVLRKGTAMAALGPTEADEMRKLAFSLLEKLSPHDDGVEPEPDEGDEVAAYDVGV